MENLAGDLVLGLKFVKLSILPTLLIHFVERRLGELRSRYLEIKDTTRSTDELRNASSTTWS